MTHPTDGELEEMAEKVLTVDGSFAELLPAHAEEICEDAAAMLRACKGGAVKVKPLQWETWEHTGLISEGHEWLERSLNRDMNLFLTRRLSDNAYCISYNLLGMPQHVSSTIYGAKQQGKAERDRRILSALEPAPDARQEAWEAEAFYALVAEGLKEADRAMIKFPQPNYVISKVAEEAGEVVKAAIHCAEGREDPENVKGEMRQLIAMIYRLWAEGDEVHGLRALAEKGPDHE